MMQPPWSTPKWQEVDTGREIGSWLWIPFPILLISQWSVQKVSFSWAKFHLYSWSTNEKPSVNPMIQELFKHHWPSLEPREVSHHESWLSMVTSRSTVSSFGSAHNHGWSYARLLIWLGLTSNIGGLIITSYKGLTKPIYNCWGPPWMSLVAWDNDCESRSMKMVRAISKHCQPTWRVWLFS